MRSYFLCQDTASTEIYTLSLHDALPISVSRSTILRRRLPSGSVIATASPTLPPSSALPSGEAMEDRKSTRLNSSHITISYAVFCLKKKNKGSEYSPYERVLYPDTLRQVV